MIKIPCKKKSLSRLVKTKEEEIKGEAEVWERQPDEPLKAFRMFQFYRDSDRRRIVSKEMLQKFKCSEHLARYYASVYSWRERARCYDNYLDKIRQRAMAKKIAEAAERHAEEAVKAQEVLMQPIIEFLRKIQDGENDFRDMTPKQLFRFVTDAVDKLHKVVEIERKALGADVNKTEVDIKSNGIGVVPTIHIEVVGTNSPLLNQIEPAKVVDNDGNESEI